MCNRIGFRKTAFVAISEKPLTLDLGPNLDFNEKSKIGIINRVFHVKEQIYGVSGKI